MVSRPCRAFCSSPATVWGAWTRRFSRAWRVHCTITPSTATAGLRCGRGYCTRHRHRTQVGVGVCIRTWASVCLFAYVCLVCVFCLFAYTCVWVSPFFIDVCLVCELCLLTCMCVWVCSLSSSCLSMLYASLHECLYVCGYGIYVHMGDEVCWYFTMRYSSRISLYAITHIQGCSQKSATAGRVCVWHIQNLSVCFYRVFIRRVPTPVSKFQQRYRRWSIGCLWNERCVYFSEVISKTHT